jgi:hypothetical protein
MKKYNLEVVKWDKIIKIEESNNYCSQIITEGEYSKSTDKEVEERLKRIIKFKKKV